MNLKKKAPLKRRRFLSANFLPANVRLIPAVPIVFHIQKRFSVMLIQISVFRIIAGDNMGIYGIPVHDSLTIFLRGHGQPFHGAIDEIHIHKEGNAPPRPFFSCPNPDNIPVGKKYLF